MNAIFNKKDFILCEVPVPKGYPQSQTHAGISLIDNDTYLLTTSPYPCIKENIILVYLKAILRKMTGGILYKRIPHGEFYENPLLFIGKSNGNSPPTKFIPYISNPLMETPKDVYGMGSYCSDPDIFIEGNKVFILNRESVRTPYVTQNGTNIKLKINIIKGLFVENIFRIINIEEFVDSCCDLVCSPCLTFYKNKYRYIYLVSSSYNTGLPCDKLVVRSDHSIEGRFTETHKVKIIKGEFEPWHMSVFQHKDILYSIITCIKRGEKQRCYQMLGEFNSDLTSLFIYKTPLVYLNSYRGSACVREDGLFVLYSTTVHEKILGSKSVDGRDVIMTSISFDSLLERLKNE